jgi:hypothetical protein
MRYKPYREHAKALSAQEAKALSSMSTAVLSVGQGPEAAAAPMSPRTLSGPTPIRGSGTLAGAGAGGGGPSLPGSPGRGSPKGAAAFFGLTPSQVPTAAQLAGMSTPMRLGTSVSLKVAAQETPRASAAAMMSPMSTKSGQDIRRGFLKNNVRKLLRRGVDKVEHLEIRTETRKHGESKVKLKYVEDYNMLESTFLTASILILVSGIMFRSAGFKKGYVCACVFDVVVDFGCDRCVYLLLWLFLQYASTVLP